MNFFKFTNDETVKRLRWVMIFTMLFDSTITLLAQPSSYWHDPSNAREGNIFFCYCLCHGLLVYLLIQLLYMLVAFLLVSVTPRRLALVSVLSFIIGHFFGASTWLTYYFHLGMSAAVIYGIVLSTAVVLLAFSGSDMPKQ